MRAGKVDRVKRRLLEAAVADNLETMRGLPPRAVRPANRRARAWLRRSPVVLIALMVAGTTYVASDPPRDTIAPAKIIIQAPRKPLAAATGAIDPTPVEAAAFPLAVSRVVLDAGHGGTDPGTVSKLNLLEKEVTLDVAKRLRALLEKEGFEVVSTRADDRTIPLRERARLANASASDIFVSIHVNSILQHTASRGVETYYLGPTNDPKLTKLAAAENHVSGYSMADLRKLLDGVYADVRRDESRRLATIIQEQLYGGLRRVDPAIENWGVKHAPFIVLVATEMPAVLAEVGCLSNPNEAALLGRPEYRQQIATALFNGIKSYASAGDAPQKKGS